MPKRDDIQKILIIADGTRRYASAPPRVAVASASTTNIRSSDVSGIRRSAAKPLDCGFCPLEVTRAA